MFYSERLLAKTGPLARVWLASNVERKLTKQQILSQDISNSVHVIVEQGDGPIALRLSAQLMLGVVKIYGRKARYLLDDCNEALVKIRMTFKSTNNHDLPNQATTTIDLNLPEQLTIDDLFPALDFGFALTQQPATQVDDRTLDDEDDWTSSLNPQTQSENAGFASGTAAVHDDDLGLDLGEDVGLGDTTISMQMGRGEATPRPDEPTELPAYDDGDDLGLDLGEDVGLPDTTARIADEPTIAFDDDQPPIALDEEAILRGVTAEREESPLSEADPEFMAEGDRTFQQMQDVEEEQAIAQQRQVSRRMKPMQADRETVLHNTEIRAWETDRARLLKPQSLLPEDPELLALLEMQRSGDFVKNAMNDTFGRGWAPEIQGLLSFDIVVRSGQKRKRDSGIADVASEDEHSDKSPRLDISEVQDEQVMIEDEGVEIREPSQSPIQPRPAVEEEHVPVETDDLAGMVPGEDDEGIYTAEGGFDETTMPLVHPADSGPISVGTQHAVHTLREVFGGSPNAGSPSAQSRKTVTLQELVPETRTSREDATKMFFEVLVLATKDAIKVEQDKQPITGTELGLPIRIRAKRGLWGQWAEPTQTEAATQEVEVGA